MFLKYIFHLTCLKQVSLFVTNVTKSPTQWVILRRNHQKGSQRFSFCQNLDHKSLSSACFLLSTEIDTRDLQRWNNAYLTYNKIIIFNLERIQNHTKLNFSFKNFKFLKNYSFINICLTFSGLQSTSTYSTIWPVQRPLR